MDDVKHMEIKETEMRVIKSKVCAKHKSKPGKGNPACGYKKDYDLYSGSDVYDRVCVAFKRHNHHNEL